MPEWNEERRNTPRVERVTLVQVTSIEDQGFQTDLATGRTLNISMGGIRLELRQHYPLPLRSILGLSVVLDNEIVEVNGTVIYLQVLDRERCAVGIQFKDLTDESREKIQRFVQKGSGVTTVVKPTGAANRPSVR